MEPRLSDVQILLTPTETIALNIMVRRLAPAGPAEESAMRHVEAAAREARRILDADDRARAKASPILGRPQDFPDRGGWVK